MAKDASWKSLPIPETNSRWDAPSINRTVRVMGEIEGYVVCRRTGCMPYLVHMSDWYKVYVPKVMPPRQRRGIELPRRA